MGRDRTQTLDLCKQQHRTINQGFSNHSVANFVITGKVGNIAQNPHGFIIGTSRLIRLIKPANAYMSIYTNNLVVAKQAQQLF